MEPKSALIIQPGLLGDCILSLPLAQWCKDAIGLERLELMAYRGYAGWLSERSIFKEVRDYMKVCPQWLNANCKSFRSDFVPYLVSMLGEFSLVLAFVYRIDSTSSKNLHSCCRAAGVKLFVPLTFVPQEDWSSTVVAWHIEQIKRELKYVHVAPEAAHDQILIFPDKFDVYAACSLLKKCVRDLDSRLCVIHPGAGVAWKRWHLDNFLCLANRIKGKGYNVVFLLGAAEEETCDCAIRSRLGPNWPVVVSPDFGLLCGLASLSKLYVGNDSGVTHLFAGAGCRTVSIFGVTNPVWYRPYGPLVDVHQASNKSMKGKDEDDVCKLMSCLWI